MPDEQDKPLDETVSESGQSLASDVIDAPSMRAENDAGSSPSASERQSEDQTERPEPQETSESQEKTTPEDQSVQAEVAAEEEHPQPAASEAQVDSGEVSEPEAAPETSVADAQATPEPSAPAAEEAASEPVAKAPSKPKPVKPKKRKKPAEDVAMDWYILKVQSNRERSVAEALQRKIAIEGLDDYFDQVIVPTEKVTEFKGGKKKVVERKLYPGYIMVHMHINDDTWFAVRETSGVGDFTGAGGKPTPMLPHEVARIVQSEEEETDEAPKLNIQFNPGDRVKVKEGNFEGFEGEVGSIDEASGRVTVMINIFGRSTPVELEYWQMESV